MRPLGGVVYEYLHSTSHAATSAPCPKRRGGNGANTHAHHPVHHPAEPSVKRGRGVLKAVAHVMPVVKVEGCLEPMTTPPQENPVRARTSSAARKCPRCENYLTPFEGETTYHCAVCSVWFMTRDDKAIHASATTTTGEAPQDPTTMQYKKVSVSRCSLLYSHHMLMT